MYYDERRSYTKRIWDVYGRIRRRTRPFTIVYELRNRRPGLVLVLAHRVNNLTFHPPFMAVITIKLSDEDPYVLKSIGIHNLPAAIDIRNEDIPRKLEVV